jgi:hypothetical protein
MMCDTKKCNKCGQELPLDQFYRRKLKSGIIGHRPYCKSCGNIAATKWQKDNPEKTRNANAKWYHNNSDKARAKSARWRKNNPERVKFTNKEWVRNNPDKKKAKDARNYRKNIKTIRASQAKYIKKRRATDPYFKMVCNIRSAVGVALRDNTKSGHTVELLGCSIEYLRSYLETLFQSGMTWDNWGKYGWHIDHIIPLSYFDLSDPEQQKRAWHYTNLRPLWATDNLKKNNKIIEIQLKLQ